jgi:hypothetical protein
MNEQNETSSTDTMLVAVGIVFMLIGWGLMLLPVINPICSGISFSIAFATSLIGYYRNR